MGLATGRPYKFLEKKPDTFWCIESFHYIYIMNNTHTHTAMKIPTTYRPFEAWSTEDLMEEIKALSKWVEMVPVCRTKAQLKKHRDLERMTWEMHYRGI